MKKYRTLKKIFAFLGARETGQLREKNVEIESSWIDSKQFRPKNSEGVVSDISTDQVLENRNYYKFFYSGSKKIEIAKSFNGISYEMERLRFGVHLVRCEEVRLKLEKLGLNTGTLFEETCPHFIPRVFIENNLNIREVTCEYPKGTAETPFYLALKEQMEVARMQLKLSIIHNRIGKN